MPVVKAIRTTGTNRASARKAPVTAAPAKKTSTRTPAKRATPVVQDTPAKRGRKPNPASTAVLPSLQERRENADPKKRIGGLSYQQLAELTGYGLGSEQFIVAVEIMKGGTSRLEVNHRCAVLLPDRTRNGTPKQVSNLVSSVIKRMEDRGFTVKGTWSMVKPAA